jgi:poly(A) polymerase
LETMMGAQPDPIARLAVLGGFELDKHLRLSRSQNKKLKEISEYSASTLGPKAIGYLCGPEKGLSTLILRAVMSDQSLSIDANYLIEEGSHATFPILASDLPSLSGPSLGQRLKLLKSTWLATELKKSKEELLKQ